MWGVGGGVVVVGFARVRVSLVGLRSGRVNDESRHGCLFCCVAFLCVGDFKTNAQFVAQIL